MCTFCCRRKIKKNAVLGKGIAVVVVLGAAKGGCREHIQSFPGRGRQHRLLGHLHCPLAGKKLLIFN